MNAGPSSQRGLQRPRGPGRALAVAGRPRAGTCPGDTAPACSECNGGWSPAMGIAAREPCVLCATVKHVTRHAHSHFFTLSQACHHVSTAQVDRSTARAGSNNARAGVVSVSGHPPSVVSPHRVSHTRSAHVIDARSAWLTRERRDWPSLPQVRAHASRRARGFAGTFTNGGGADRGMQRPDTAWHNGGARRCDGGRRRCRSGSCYSFAFFSE